MISAYPFERLPRVGRHQVEALRALRALLGALDQDAVRATAERLFAGPVRASPGALELCSFEEIAAQLPGSFVAVALSHGASRTREHIVLEANTQAAACVVGHVLGSDDALVDAHAAIPLDDLQRGVLAYVMARLLAASSTGFELHAVIDTPSEVLRALAAPAIAVCPIEVVIGMRPLLVRVLWPTRLRGPALRRSDDNHVPGWLATLPVNLELHAGTATLSALQLAELRKRDVVVLDRSRLVSKDGSFEGTLRMQVSGAATAWSCAVTGEQRLTVEQRVLEAASCVSQGGVVSTTSNEASGNGASALSQTVPVELRVVVGRVTLSFAELSSLREGDVVTTHKAIGQAVVLEAAGRGIAEGELVDIDGELGVRVLRLLAPA
jgi:type III secretion protein Q